jgi:hypothetical protein
MGHSLSCSGISRRDEDGWLSNAVLSAGVVRPGPGFQILITGLTFGCWIEKD